MYFAYKFTGKERDSESGLDNFGARYNSSQYGRFMTPDWSAKPQGVPYAVLGNPQSLNLYAYVLNNPMSNRDLDGHWCVWGIGTSCPPPTPPQPQKTNVPPMLIPLQAPDSMKPHTGGSLGVQVSGQAVAGVGKAATGATGSLNPLTVQYDATTGHPNVAASASGGTLAKWGAHVFGKPQQDGSSTVAGGFIGATVAILISNAGNSTGLKQSSETISFDFGQGYGGSLSMTLSNGSIATFQLGVGYGFGAAYSDIKTGTAATGTDW